ncbi:MAG TPA: chloride channel protein [Bacteroidia bacterium]|jgi:CIC family chloride channel protein|nr:chloride channel protein [Bacteroidia bacterium]
MIPSKLSQKIAGWKLGLSHRNFFLVLSVVVGTAAGLAAVLLKLTTHYLEVLLHVFDQAENYKLLIYPVIGILLATAYTQIFQKGKLGRGISNVISNIYNKESYMEKDKMYSHMITSSLTVGFGGSMGLEAPIVVTGSALGSNIAKFFNLDYKERTLLLACGAAAGISAIFSAPIAGVLFAIEVLLGEFSTVNFVPLLMASAVASVISQVANGGHGQIFYIFSQGWDLKALPFYVVLSIITGLYSLYIMKGIAYSENLLSGVKKPYLKAIIGGVILGLAIFLLPPLYGEGYHTVQMLLNTEYGKLFDGSILYKFHESPFALVMFTIAILLVKVVATQLTISSGGNGGFFAPSLFMGAMLGFLYVYVVKLLGIYNLNEPNFIAVAMAGVMAGVMHTPLTAIFLIAEVTGGYSLLVPLMIVSSLSFLISKYFNPNSIYVKH